MGVRLSEEEIWDTLATAHTGIFTTLRKDGMPIALPVWFAVLDRKIYVGGVAKTKKWDRVRNDPRCSFLVESGLRWAELKAVQVNGQCRFVDDAALKKRVREQLDKKYSPFRTASTKMPDKTREHYADEWMLVEVTPDARVLSWDNSKLFKPRAA
jgi:nitroimidazol reductase NimA-like FMN-containing flavoprotein (pyridoxamine 5'-phosphate oxidase superfamily)